MRTCTTHRLGMISRLLSLVNFVTALGAGLVAGVFFAFSSFVLPALARLTPAQGVNAMQSINVAVLNRWFLGVFLGTAVGCCALSLDAFARSAAPGARLRLTGSALYLVGSLLVTRAGNVPWNDALAALVPNAKGTARAWATYVDWWGLWNHVRTAASLLATALLMLGVNGCSRYWECAPPDATRLRELPQRLSETGLFAPGQTERLADGMREFKPQFELWSDGAVKRRWLSLPAGEPIDTSNMDNWVFPTGTQLWKEFVVDGVRVETRLLRKVGAGAEDWVAQAYVWAPDGSDAVATPSGKNDVLGTAHDVPAAGECMACHGGRKSFVLGFSALQLAYDAPPDQLDLDALIAERRITRAPAVSPSVPGDSTARAALGYLHANCGHCHNQDRPAASASRCYDPDNELDFWLKTSELTTVARTAAYRSGRGVAFEPGQPQSSRMIELMSERGFLKQMPPLGTEHVDARGLAVVKRWIAELR
jgi:uncharacterized membrane protein